MIYYKLQGRFENCNKIPADIIDYNPNTGDIEIGTHLGKANCKLADLAADGGQTEINDRIAEIMRAREEGWSSSTINATCERIAR